MSNFIINNIDSFSFDESYSVTHGYVNEFPELENSNIPQVNPIPPNVNPVPPNVNPIVLHVNPNAPHVNPIPPHVNPIPPHVNPNAPHVNPIPPHVNPNAPQQNNNNQNDELNILYKSIATLISNHFAQKNVHFPNNVNGQNDGQENLNVPVQDNNQINNDPTVRIKHMLLNQLLQLYDPPKQNQPPNNQQNAQQQNQPPNNQHNAQQQNQPPNNQNFNFANLSMRSSIQDEINSNLKKLIALNKFQGLTTIFLYNESNEFQKKLLTELINSNKEQREYNKTIGETIKEILVHIKDNKESQNSNNN